MYDSLCFFHRAEVMQAQKIPVMSFIHLFFELVEAAKGEKEILSAVSAKLNYSRMADKKSSIAIFDFQLLESATNSFSEDNIMGETGSIIVYRARFDEHFQAAVKKADSNADREFEVMILYNKISMCTISLHTEFAFSYYTEFAE